MIDGPRVGSPDSLAYFVVMKRPIAPVSKIPMATRAWYLKPMMCWMSCLFKLCVVDIGSLKCTLCPLVWWMFSGVV